MTLIAKNVSKNFGDFKVLQDVSMELTPGQIHALVGENGAGKTTLLRILAGIYQADKGLVSFGAESVFDNPVAKAQLAFVPAASELIPSMNQKALARFYKSFYPDFDEAYFLELTKGLNMGKKPVRRLSTGMKMLLTVSIAMARRPQVLLLDEPFAGLDVVVKKQLMDLISAQEGIAILISSHNLQDLERISDEVTFLMKGQITASGDMFAVKDNAFKRIQVVFEKDAPVDLIEWQGITHVAQLGRVITLTYEGDDAELEARLTAHGVLMLDRLGSTLEEAFIHSYEQYVSKGGKNQ
jgi:ABC-type multidrug transport system, ATPase component